MLFIDEIHRLGAVVEEYLYPAMEDFQIDFVVDRGAYAKTLKLPLKRFTLVGATTRAGMLSAPLRDRFGLDVSPRLLRAGRSAAASSNAARASSTCASMSRGRRDDRPAQPRHAAHREPAVAARARLCRSARRRRRHRRRSPTKRCAAKASTSAGSTGSIAPTCARSPKATAAARSASTRSRRRLTEDLETLEDVVEPYLLKIGFVQRTAAGRKTTAAAFAHLGLSRAERSRPSRAVHVIARAVFLKGVAGRDRRLGHLGSARSRTAARRRRRPRGAAPGTRSCACNSRGGSIATLDVETYLYGVVPLESPPELAGGRVAAQAIVARTYALAQAHALARRYDVTASDADQRYGGAAAEHPATSAAVDATRGQTLAYLGGPASVFYSACCGGHSADADELWGHAGLPYLRGVDDPYCTAPPGLSLAARAAARPRASGARRPPERHRRSPPSSSDPDDSGRPRRSPSTADGGAVLALSVSDVRARFGDSIPFAACGSRDRLRSHAGRTARRHRRLGPWSRCRTLSVGRARNGSHRGRCSDDSGPFFPGHRGDRWLIRKNARQPAPFDYVNTSPSASKKS